MDRLPICASHTTKSTTLSASEQPTQHLREQAIRCIQIEGGVHDLLQRQPIKESEQESRQNRWIERGAFHAFCPLQILHDPGHDRANFLPSLVQPFSHRWCNDGVV